MSKTVDLQVAAQAGVGAYTLLISTISVGYYMQKMISIWHAFVMTAGLLLASKLFELNQGSATSAISEILLVGGCFVSASAVA